MKTYKRKKISTVFAEQWYPEKNVEGVQKDDENNNYFVITIHKQRCYLSPGDYVVREPILDKLDRQYYYPVKAEIFEETYELDHPPTKDCPYLECTICSERDCPHEDPLHYHHDGCPSCNILCCEIL